MNGQTFTAAEIGAALGWSRFKVRRALAAITATGNKIVRNKHADTWALDDLPTALRKPLEESQARQNIRSTPEMLRKPLPRYAPVLPLSEIDDAEITKAQKLQRALTPALTMADQFPTSTRAALAVASYRKEFGHEVSVRTLGKLIETVQRRDGNLREYSTRLELFLPEHPKAKRRILAPRVVCLEFPELDVELSAVEDRTAPTAEDLSYCWRKIVRAYFARCTEGADTTALKRTLRDYLWRVAPFLADSEVALKRNLNRKLAEAATDGIAALCDGRARPATAREGRWGKDYDMLAKWTVLRKGKLSMAYRELQLDTAPNGWRFSEGFRKAFPFDVRRAKSKVPAKVRSEVTPLIKIVRERILGLRATRNKQPSTHRDWRDTPANAIHTADDFTPDCRWYEWTDDGEFKFDGRRFNIGRGQLILFCDERTGLPLYFDLSLNEQPNSRMVFTGLSRMWRNEGIGLPSIGANFERNIFDSLKVRSLFSWSKIDASFEREGIQLRLRNYTRPQGKIIEGIGGRLHLLMNHLPAYVGSDEQHICHERIQTFCSRLKRVGQPRKAELDPRKMLLSKEEMAAQYVRALESFANEPQNGERLPGLSPKEAWSQLVNAGTGRTLPESLAYLICTERSEQTVTHEGVRVRNVGGGWNFYYGHERLGALRDQKVEVYFNPEIPEHVTVLHRRSDPAGRDPFSVPLSVRLPANTATREDFARERAQKRAFGKTAESTWRFLQPPRSLTICNSQLGTPEMRELGDRINTLDREVIDLRGKRDRNRGEILALAVSQNLPIANPATIRNPERVVAGLRKMAEAREKIRRIEAGEDEPSDTTS